MLFLEKKLFEMWLYLNVTGMRFGLLQTKVGLVSLLSKYNFQVCHKTSVPLKLDTKSFITSAVGGMWLKITKRV
jgi:cytochrome P450 family 6